MSRVIWSGDSERPIVTAFPNQETTNVRNRRIGMVRVMGLAIALTAGGPGPADAAAQDAGYRDFDDLTAELRALTGGSNLARMSSIGTTLGGRDIWVVEVASPDGPPVAERPGLLVVGSLSADHLVGSAHAVAIVRHLTGNAPDSAVAEVLADRVVYVIPRLNPDGAEAMFAATRADVRGNTRPFDDDNDGRVDEDGSEDLDGDGAVTVMRVLDPKGAYMIDPDEPRLLKRADPAKGETGAYAVYREGTDDDGDGFLNEDGPGGVDLDRNFQHAYPYWERDAGPHMVSEPETRALMDFVIAHRNIGAILTIGHTDNLVTPPNSSGALADASTLDLPAFADASNDSVFDVGVSASGGGGFGFGFFGGGGFRGAQPGRDNDPNSGRRPATTVDGDDREYFSAVSEAYREITGIERVAVNREAEGAFFQYGYFQFGVPAFSTQGWGLPDAEGTEEGEAAEGGAREEAQAGAGARRGPPGGGRGNGGGGSGGADARVLRALEAAGIEAFADWTPFAHPTLGEVEIGGFLPYATTNPPAADLADLGARHGEFAVRLAGMLPRVRIVETEVTDHGGGIFTVEAEVENRGFFPTALAHGVTAEAVDPVTIRIQVPPEAVLTGADKTSEIESLDGSGSRRGFTWVIRGQSGQQVEIRLRAQKGGTDVATVTLR